MIIIGAPIANDPTSDQVFGHGCCSEVIALGRIGALRCHGTNLGHYAHIEIMFSRRNKVNVSVVGRHGMLPA